MCSHSISLLAPSFFFSQVIYFSLLFSSSFFRLFAALLLPSSCPISFISLFLLLFFSPLSISSFLQFSSLNLFIYFLLFSQYLQFSSIVFSITFPLFPSFLLIYSIFITSESLPFLTLFPPLLHIFPFLLSISIVSLPPSFSVDKN